MTAQLQLFMILGAVVLLLIIFAFLKRGLMSVKYSLLWLALVVLLSLSIAISQLADKCKRLTQANAMLEKRVRDLEEKK